MAPLLNQEQSVINLVRANKGFLLFLLLFGVFRTAVADWSPIPSGSMRPNLLEGDVVLINRLAYDLKIPLTERQVAHLGDPVRGDVVVFYSPRDGTRLIKRVLALPGDVVEMRDDRLRINGEGAAYALVGSARELAGGREVDAVRLSESVGGARQRVQLLPRVPALRDIALLRIPPGQYLMLGDNRNNSADSRVIGLVPRAKLLGRAERILVSTDYQHDWMPRFERFGMALRAR
jgi:signal peptidase I